MPLAGVPPHLMFVRLSGDPIQGYCRFTIDVSIRLFFTDKLVGMGAPNRPIDPTLHSKWTVHPYGEKIRKPLHPAQAWALVHAALSAQGKSVIRNIAPNRPRYRKSIKTAALGASIKRVKE